MGALGLGACPVLKTGNCRVEEEIIVYLLIKLYTLLCSLVVTTTVLPHYLVYSYASV